MTTECLKCNPVTQEQCQLHREDFQCTIEKHDEQLHAKDVRDAKCEGIQEVQTKVLWGIFGVSVLSFFSQFIGPFFVR